MMKKKYGTNIQQDLEAKKKKIILGEFSNKQPLNSTTKFGSAQQSH